MTKHRAFSLTFALGLVLVSGCGGDDTTPTGALDASSVSNAADTFNALEGLLNSVDTSTQTKLSAGGRTLGSRGLVVGDTSFTGCHNNAGKNRLLRNIRIIEDPICKITQAEKADVGFSIPEGDYAYYSITGGDDDSSEGFVLRGKRYVNDAGFKCLSFQTCRDGSQNQSFQFCNIEGGVEANTQHAFSDVGPDGDVHQGKGSIGVTAHGPDLDTLTDATISSAFTDTFGAGSASLTMDGTALTYSMDGFFGGTFSDFTNETGMCSQGGQGIGSAHVVSNATFPPWHDPITDKYYCPNNNDFSAQTEVTVTDTCSGTFDEIESFERVAESEPAKFTVIDNAVSPFYTAVTACTVPTEATAPSDFGTAWDCTAPNGFTAVDASTVDFTECDVIQQEIRTGDQEERSCEQKALE